MTSMYTNPMHQMRNQVAALTNSVNTINDTLQKCGIEASGGYKMEDLVRPIAHNMIEDAISKLRSQIKEDIKKERHLLDVAMTYKCEHAISQAVRDKFEFLTKRCDVLGEKIDEISEKAATTSSRTGVTDDAPHVPVAPSADEIVAVMSKDWDRRLEEIRASSMAELDQRVKHAEEMLQRKIEDKVSSSLEENVRAVIAEGGSRNDDLTTAGDERKEEQEQQQYPLEHESPSDDHPFVEQEHPQAQAQQQQQLVQFQNDVVDNGETDNNNKQNEEENPPPSKTTSRKGGAASSRPVRARKNATLRL